MVNLIICNQVLASQRWKRTKRDKEVKLQLRNLGKIRKAIKSIKDINNKLIIDLNLQSVNIKLEKNWIMESNNKDSALLVNLPTPTPKNKSPNSFACVFGIVLPNLRQPFLSMKKSEKDALKMKIKDTVYLTSFSNPWLQDIVPGIFLS